MLKMDILLIVARHSLQTFLACWMSAGHRLLIIDFKRCGIESTWLRGGHSMFGIVSTLAGAVTVVIAMVLVMSAESVNAMYASSACRVECGRWRSSFVPLKLGCSEERSPGLFHSCCDFTGWVSSLLGIKTVTVHIRKV